MSIFITTINIGGRYGIDPDTGYPDGSVLFPTETRDLWYHQVVEPIFASTYIRRFYEPRAEGDPSRSGPGYENGEVLVYGDGGRDYENPVYEDERGSFIVDPSREPDAVPYMAHPQWRIRFVNWTKAEARTWLNTTIGPRIREALIYLNNVYGPLDKYDAILGHDWGAYTMRMLEEPFLSVFSNAYSETEGTTEPIYIRQIRNAKKIIRTLLIFDDGYGCLSKEERQDTERFSYPLKVPVKFSTQYFDYKFKALGYHRWSSDFITNFPDIEDGTCPFGLSPISFRTWTENAFPQEIEEIVSAPITSEYTDERLLTYPGVRQVQCPILPEPSYLGTEGAEIPPLSSAIPPCPERDLVEELSRDQECTPDTTQLIPQWTTEMKPFLNSRVCEYFIPIQTPYNCVGAEEFAERAQEFSEEAINSLLDFTNKNATENQRLILTNFVINENFYDFDKAPNVDVKLLYRWPFNLIRALNLEERPPSRLSDSNTFGNNVEILTSNLISDLDALQLILKTLGPQQIQLWTNDKAKILFDGSLQEANILQQADYVFALRTAIVSLLDENNYIFPESVVDEAGGSQFPIPSEGIVASELKFYYDSQYKLTSVFVRESGTEYVELNTSSLGDSSPIRNPTMMSYLTNLSRIVSENENSQELSIQPFLQRYHYPPVRLSFQSAMPERPILGDNCSEGVLEDVANSVLDGLIDSANELVGRFADNLCMTSDQIDQKEAEIQASAEDIKNMLSEEGMKNLVMQDPIISNIASSVKAINNSKDTIRAAWTNLFDKLTVCGLFGLMSSTIELIAKNDVCGITPETALTIAIKSSLKKVETDILRRIYNSIPPNTQNELQNAYSQRFREYAQSVGYNGPSSFPWDLEEQNRRAERDKRERRVIYDGSLFTSPSLEQTQSRYENSYRSGYAANAEFDTSYFVTLSGGGYDEGSFWAGYVASQTDELNGVPREPSLVVPPRRADVLTDAQRLESNSSSNNSSAFGRLAGGLMADTVKFAIEIFIDGLTESLSLDELLEQTTDIPAVGAIMQAVPDVAKCAIDIKFFSGQEGGEQINMSTIQNNLQNGLKGDICEIVGGLSSLTLPDIEATFNTNLNSRTLKAAFVNALIKTLRNLIIKVLLNSLLKIISKTTAVLYGALCEATKSNLSAAIEGSIAGNVATQVYTPPGNIATLFADAFCGTSGRTNSAEAQASSIISSLTGRPSTDPASSSASCSLIDGLANRLRMDQLLDLMEGTASENVINVVLSVSRNECSEFSEFLFDEASVRSFFSNLSTSFPGQFLQQTRDTLGAFGADRENIITSCDTEADLSGLEQALRDECGDNISEEQIQQQLATFQQRIEDTVSELAEIMSGGFSESMSDTIQNTLSNIVPKDDPTNVVLMSEIVDSMFDPLYTFYSMGLLAPIAPNGDGGFMNVALSNKKAVPLKGQHAAFGASCALLAGPIAVLLPGLGTVLAENLIDDLRYGFFGDGSRGDEPVCEKPDTVAEYLRQLFNDGSFISSSNTGDAITLSFYSVSDTLMFQIDYDFISNSGTLKRFDPFGLPLAGDGATINFASNDVDSAFEQIQDYLNDNSSNLSPAEVSRPYVGAITSPIQAGISTIIHNLLVGEVIDPLNLGLYEATFSATTQNLISLIRTLKTRTIGSLSRSLYFNKNAFSYGNYILDQVTDVDVLAGAEWMSERGYETVYLDDGNYIVVPPRKGGWLELKEILLPKKQDEYCCPDKKELLDIPSIKSVTLAAYEASDEDERLYKNPRRVREAPYAHISGRATTACIEGVVKTTMRIYLIEHILSGYASFSRYKTNIPSVYSDLLADYISKKMKMGMMGQSPRPAAPIGPEEEGLHGYWYEFLEQAVEVYLKRAESGRTTINAETDVALRVISDYSENYIYPQRNELIEERSNTSRPFLTLKKMRREKNILAIRDTEDSALVILKNLIKQEFETISDIVEGIFPTPEGGWVSDIRVDFLRNAYFSGNRGIFDIPTFDGDVLGGIRSDAGDFNEEGSFILQAYVRPVLKEEPPPPGPELEFYERMQTRLRSGVIFGLEEMRNYIEEDAIASSVSAFPNVSTIFSSFKYGLRLVYVLSDQEVENLNGDGGDLVRILNRTDPLTRLYSHPHALPGRTFLLSIPIVFSENVEVEFEATSLANFMSATDPALIEQQSLDRLSEFNWPLLSELLINSQQFRAMFEYAIPLTTMQSLVAMFNIEAFPNSIGRDDGWTSPIVPPVPPTAAGIIPPIIPLPPSNFNRWNKKAFQFMKRKLKILFNTLYRANDFTYTPGFDSQIQETVRQEVESTNADTWSDGLSAETRSRVIFEDPLCFTPPEETVADSDEDSESDTTSSGATRRDTTADHHTGGGRRYVGDYVCLRYSNTRSGFSGTWYQIMTRTEAEAFGRCHPEVRGVSWEDMPADYSDGPAGPSRLALCGS